MAKDKTSGLTDKQLLFCQYYIISLNASESARKAGYSDKTAQQVSSRLLLNVVIQAEIQKLMNKRADKLEITAEMVLSELANLGFSDIKEFFDEGYSIKMLADLKDKSKCIQSIQIDDTSGEFGNSRSVKFKLHDKLRALENICKHISFYAPTKTDITSKGEAINTDPFKMIRENSGITDKK